MKGWPSWLVLVIIIIGSASPASRASLLIGKPSKQGLPPGGTTDQDPNLYPHFDLVIVAKVGT